MGQQATAPDCCCLKVSLCGKCTVQFLLLSQNVHPDSIVQYRLGQHHDVTKQKSLVFTPDSVPTSGLGESIICKLNDLLRRGAPLLAWI